MCPARLQCPTQAVVPTMQSQTYKTDRLEMPSADSAAAQFRP